MNRKELLASLTLEDANKMVESGSKGIKEYRLATDSELLKHRDILSDIKSIRVDMDSVGLITDSLV